MLFSPANEFMETSSESEEDGDVFKNNEFQCTIQNQINNSKIKKEKKNFYKKLKEERVTSKEENNLSNVNSMNILQLQQKVAELTKECRRLDIYVDDSMVLVHVEEAEEEEGKQSEIRQADDINKNNVKDDTTDAVKLLKSHKKLQQQRVGGGTGNTKCHKKYIKKEQMARLSNTIKNLEHLLQDYHDQEKKTQTAGVRRKQTKK